MTQAATDAGQAASRRVEAFGPLAEGVALGAGFVVSRLALGEKALEVTTERAVFVVQHPEHPDVSGPFDSGAFRIWYRLTPCPWPELKPVGTALRDLVARASSGEAPSALWRRWCDEARFAPVEPAPVPTPAPIEPPIRVGSSPPPTFHDRLAPPATAEGWQERARRHLVGHAGRALRVEDLLPASAIPDWACVQPWTQLQISSSLHFGPCCIDYQVKRQLVGDYAGDLEGLWNSAPLRDFRRAIRTKQEGETCSSTCPTLHSGRERLAGMAINGGPEVFVASQIGRLEEILAGTEEVRSGPLDLMFSATSYCNYDCLMCDYGEVGTLADELPPAFYDAIVSRLDRLRFIGVTGGEPMASPNFRQFLAQMDFERHPQLRLGLTTNFSYLTPKELDGLHRVPWGSLSISLNAATAETYRLVNRGLSWDRIRANLDHLLKLQAAGRYAEQLTYTMVVIKANHREIEAFSELAFADGVSVRYLLPHYNRNDQSVFTDEACMLAAAAALERVAQREAGRGRAEDGREAGARAEILRDRLRERIFRPVPDLQKSPRIVHLKQFVLG